MGKKDTSQNKDDGHFGSSYSLDSSEKTLEHYRTWAQTYDQEIGKENSYAQPDRVAETLSRYCVPKAIILDAGCGSGLSGEALARAGFSQLDGCDFSPEMLAKATAKQMYQNLWEADLNLPMTNVPDNTYEAVVCVGVFSFGHVSPDSCDEILRILKPHGVLVIALNEQFWDKGDLKRKIADLIASPAKAEHLVSEFGDHLPGQNVNGWVIVLRKTA